MPNEREFIDLRLPDLRRERAAFSARVIGQERVAESFAFLEAKILSGIHSKRPKPLDVKFLLGPSGVGKTASVYALAEHLCADFPKENVEPEGRVLKIDAGDFKDGSQLARLLGSPPGYRGSRDALTGSSGIPALFCEESLADYKIVFRNAAGRRGSVLLLLVDEVEKGGPALQDALLSIMDRGYMRLADNTMADFRNAVIFFTSNIGSSRAEQKRLKAVRTPGYKVPGVFADGMRDTLLDPDLLGEIEAGYREDFRDHFRAEFRNRGSEVLVFRPLSREHLTLIAAKMVSEIVEDFESSDPSIQLKLEVTSEVLEWLVDQSYDSFGGARALASFIESNVGEPLKAVHERSNLHGSVIAVQLGTGGGSLAFREEVLAKPGRLTQEVKRVVSQDNSGFSGQTK